MGSSQDSNSNKSRTSIKRVLGSSVTLRMMKMTFGTKLAMMPLLNKTDFIANLSLNFKTKSKLNLAEKLHLKIN